VPAGRAAATSRQIARKLLGAAAIAGAERAAEFDRPRSAAKTVRPTVNATYTGPPGTRS
jgi:hypothetical protein